MRMSTITRAPEDHRFGPGCFDKSVGKTFTVNLPDGKKGTGTLESYDIIEGGQALELHFSIEED